MELVRIEVGSCLRSASSYFAFEDKYKSFPISISGRVIISWIGEKLRLCDMLHPHNFTAPLGELVSAYFTAIKRNKQLQTTYMAFAMWNQIAGVCDGPGIRQCEGMQEETSYYSYLFISFTFFCIICLALVIFCVCESFLSVCLSVCRVCIRNVNFLLKPLFDAKI